MVAIANAMFTRSLASNTLIRFREDYEIASSRGSSGNRSGDKDHAGFARPMVVKEVSVSRRIAAAESAASSGRWIKQRQAKDQEVLPR